MDDLSTLLLCLYNIKISPKNSALQLLGTKVGALCDLTIGWESVKIYLDGKTMLWG